MRGEAKKVLIVDDDADMRTMIAEFLQTEGFVVLEAKNGLEALLHVKRARPAAVVLDLMMPRLGGLEALKRIRAFDPVIKVVVVTGDEGEPRQRALSLGALAVLTKPVALADLLAALGGPPSPSPAKASAPDSVQTTPVAARPTTKHRGRVLIVDDDADMCTMLEEFVSRLGYQTGSVSDGLAAVGAVTSHPPDLILLDIEMPHLSGTDALPWLRTLAPDAKVIMVSGSKSAEIARQTLAYGAFDYVVKPVDLDYLAQSMETALLMKQLEA